jgi:arylsulfatase A-like enzyme
MGPRGDAIIEFDWSVGEILNAVERLGLSKNTLIILTSDNGPVVDDGYHDQSVELLGNHKPAGPLRGGKYSSFEAGTRVMFIAGWKGTIKPGRSEALFSQIDLMASFAELSGQVLPSGTGTDSFSNLGALLGKSESSREWVIQQGSGGKLSIVKDGWKYIEPGQGPRVYASVNIESGRDSLPQLYNLKPDIGELNNMAATNPEIARDLADLLETIKSASVLR